MEFKADTMAVREFEKSMYCESPLQIKGMSLIGDWNIYPEAFSFEFKGDTMAIRKLKRTTYCKLP